MTLVRACLIPLVAALTVTGCSRPATPRPSTAAPATATTVASSTNAAPSSTARSTIPVPTATPVIPSPTQGSPQPTAPLQTFATGSAEDVMAQFAVAWCPFAWNQDPAQRIAAARRFTTPDAPLLIDPQFLRAIDAAHTVATCGDPRVEAVQGAADTATRRYLRAFAVRTSRDATTGVIGTQSWYEPRVVVLTPAGWRVDRPFVGG